jgi:hypothetical protein
MSDLSEDLLGDYDLDELGAPSPRWVQEANDMSDDLEPTVPSSGQVADPEAPRPADPAGTSIPLDDDEDTPAPPEVDGAVPPGADTP